MRLNCEYDDPQPRRRKRKASHPAAPPPIRPAPVPSIPLSASTPPLQQALLDPAEHKRQQDIRKGIGVHETESGAFQFYGASSHFCFLERNYQHIDRNGHDGMPKGVRKWKLHHFMFNFRNHHGPVHDSLAEVHIRKELGDSFIREYFKTIDPSANACPAQIRDRRDLVQILGHSGAEQQAAEGQRTGSSCSRPRRQGISMYAFQLMKQNDAYLYLGYAAKNALTLGLHKSEVVQGNSYGQHRLRTTFWVIYAYERISSFFSGRPSGILDDQIDASYPEDIVVDNPDCVSDGSCAEFAFIRIAADMGRLANKIASDVYFPKSLKYVSDMARVMEVAHECAAELDSLAHSLPPYLQFYDVHSPIGESWKEIQRASLGMWYHLTHMLIHRPALTYATFFPSRVEAQKVAGDLFDINAAIEASVASAKSVIRLATEACCRRAPDLKSDGGVAFFLLVASITLLYDVLDPGTTPSYARATFEVVESAIHTLDLMQHVGPNNSKELSLDIMKFAKDALLSGGDEIDWERDLTESFPWLSNVFAEPYTGFPSLPSDPMLSATPQTLGPTTTPAQQGVDAGAIPTSVTNGMHYVSQWPPTSSDVLDIPDSLL
ncbi:hypothetical protein SLS57_011882 [Botryosphaeria dothidea]